MKYDPISDEEMENQKGTLTPGLADFEIIKAVDDISKNGNPMMKLQVNVVDSKGREGTIFDYITSNAQWRIKGLLDSLGNPDLYTSGNIIPSDLVGGKGQAILFLQKDKTGQYGDSIKIRDYLPREEVKQPAPQSDDIPF